MIQSRGILEVFRLLSRNMLDKRQIALLRNRIGWSQSEMARALGLANPMTISHWETGVSNPTGAIMRFLCLLESFSDADLKKYTKRLEQFSQGNFKAHD